MRVISRKPIDDFVTSHPNAEQPLLAWFREAKAAHWKNPQDIKTRYAGASFLPDNTVIFNIKGNHYRLTTRVAYNTGIVYIVSIQTHADYDKKK